MAAAVTATPSARARRGDPAPPWPQAGASGERTRSGSRSPRRKPSRQPTSPLPGVEDEGDGGRQQQRVGARARPARAATSPAAPITPARWIEGPAPVHRVRRGRSARAAPANARCRVRPSSASSGQARRQSRRTFCPETASRWARPERLKSSRTGASIRSSSPRTKPRARAPTRARMPFSGLLRPQADPIDRPWRAPPRAPSAGLLRGLRRVIAIPRRPAPWPAMARGRQAPRGADRWIQPATPPPDRARSPAPVRPGCRDER